MNQAVHLAQVIQLTYDIIVLDICLIVCFVLFCSPPPPPKKKKKKKTKKKKLVTCVYYIHNEVRLILAYSKPNWRVSVRSENKLKESNGTCA